MSERAVTVIIPVFHGDQWVPACLKSLLAHADEDVRVWLVDNHGNSDLSHWTEYDERVRIIHVDGPLPFAEVNDRVLCQERIHTPFVCFLNQDTVSDENWLRRCIDVLQSSAWLGAVTPWLLDYAAERPEPAILSCLPEGLQQRPVSVTGFQCTEVVPATALVCRWDALLRTGPFDPVFQSYYEDFDLCDRLQEHDFGVAIVHAVSVRHQAGSATTTPAAALRRARNVLRNRVIRRLRRSQSNRITVLFDVLLLEFPRRTLRALARRPGAAPLRAVLGAAWDVLLLSPRMVSEARDKAAWRRDLVRLGWPDEMSGSRDASS